MGAMAPMQGAFKHDETIVDHRCGWWLGGNVPRTFDPKPPAAPVINNRFIMIERSLHRGIAPITYPY